MPSSAPLTSRPKLPQTAQGIGHLCLPALHLLYSFWPCRRKVYDQTGSIEDSEELAGEQFDSLYKYYRNIYKQVTEEDIVKVEEEYRGSEEEALDVVKFYEMHKGNMEKVCLHLLLTEHPCTEISARYRQQSKDDTFSGHKQNGYTFQNDPFLHWQEPLIAHAWPSRCQHAKFARLQLHCL